MNWWVYFGYIAVCFIGFLVFTLVCIDIFICVDNYYEDKKDKEIATCDGCKYIAYDSGGRAFCSAGVSEDALEVLNDINMRPCKEDRNDQ